jgi:hypothetical protein
LTFDILTVGKRRVDKITWHLAVAGDVVVGWVNARTGKGEIDDYFLAGNQVKCDDGAESCPDVSKPVMAKKTEAELTILTFFCGRNYPNIWFLKIVMKIVKFSL